MACFSVFRILLQYRFIRPYRSLIVILLKAGIPQIVAGILHYLFALDLFK